MCKRTIPTLSIALAIVILTRPMFMAASALPPGNTVEQWNAIAENAVVGSGAFQAKGFIYMGYVSAAVYDVVVSIEGGYAPYGAVIPDAPARQRMQRQSRSHTERSSTTFPARQ